MYFHQSSHQFTGGIDFSFSAQDLTVYFTDTSTPSSGNSLSSWLWDFGDGSGSSDRHPLYTYLIAGSYTVQLTVTDDDSHSDTVAADISVPVLPEYCDSAGQLSSYEWLSQVEIGGVPNLPPTAGFGFVASDLVVEFTDSSSDPDGAIVAWAWDFGDGTSSGDQNPVHTYATDGSYSVTLTVIDDQGLDDSVAQLVEVSDPIEIIELENGVPLSGLSAPQGDWLYFQIEVPQNTRLVYVRTSSGSGNADLYTRSGELPTAAEHDCNSQRPDNAELCWAIGPETGDYFIGVHASEAFDGLSITAYLR